MEQWVFSLGEAECEDPAAEPVCLLASVCPWLSALRSSRFLSQLEVSIQEDLQEGHLMTVNIQVTKPGF